MSEKDKSGVEVIPGHEFYQFESRLLYKKLTFTKLAPSQTPSDAPASLLVMEPQVPPPNPDPPGRKD